MPFKIGHVPSNLLKTSSVSDLNDLKRHSLSIPVIRKSKREIYTLRQQEDEWAQMHRGKVLQEDLVMEMERQESQQAKDFYRRDLQNQITDALEHKAKDKAMQRKHKYVAMVDKMDAMYSSRSKVATIDAATGGRSKRPMPSMYTIDMSVDV